MQTLNSYLNKQSGDLDSLLERKLLLVTGKGGIGKTYTSAALAIEAANRGKKVLLVESVFCDQLAPLFGRVGKPHKLVELSPAIHCINLENDKNLQDYVVNYLGQSKLFKSIFSNKVVKTFLQTIPGLSEIMLLGRLYYMCEVKPEYDLVIFDGFASGHFLSLMTTPAAILQTDLGGPLVKQAQNIQQFLKSENSAMICVSILQSLPVSEALDFIPKLMAHAPTELAALIINRAWPGDVRSSADFELVAYERCEQALIAGMSSDAKLKTVPLLALAERGWIEEPLDLTYPYWQQMEVQGGTER